MEERRALLKKLQAAQFAMIEANLFLDTHPCDKDALDYYTEMQKSWRELMEQFTSKYGALSSLEVTTDNCFEWVNDPWPWETEV